MHQPSYKDAETGEYLLPWARLHATKDYRDMVALLRPFPRVHATFNLTPILLEQLEAIASGESDLYLDVARRPAIDLSETDRRFLLDHFFDVNHTRMLEPHAPYRKLFLRARHETFTTQELRDLQVWFHLAWVDPSFHGEEPMQSLLRKGTGFTEVEKQALLDWGIQCSGAVAGAYRAAAALGQIELSTSAYHHPILPLLIDGDSPREQDPSRVLPSPPFRAPEDAAEQIRRARSSHERRFGLPPRGTWPPEGSVDDAALAMLAQAGFNWVASDEALLAAALTKRDGELRGWPGALYRPHQVMTSVGPIVMVFRDRALSDTIGFTYAAWDPEQAAEDFIRRVHAVRQTATPDLAPLVTVILDGENCWEFYPDDGGPFLSALYERLQNDPEIEPVTVSEALAMEEIYAAEASDWFWWYGEDHQSSHRAEFDRLFRAHLIQAYRLVGATVPESLAGSLRDPESSDAHDTGVYLPESAAGTHHRASSCVRSIRYGIDGDHLSVRIELSGAASAETDGLIAIELEGTPVLRVEAPVGPVVLVRVPRERWGAEPGHAVRFRVKVERRGEAAEVAPVIGWFQVSPGP
jgi:alpha-amylase/alpha-mannosidase (GH57 family)